MEQNYNLDAYRLERVIEQFGSERVKVIPGGTVTDYVCAYLKTAGEDHNLPDAMRWLKAMVPLDGRNTTQHATLSSTKNFRLVEVEPLEDLALLRYLERLHLPIGLAAQLLDEVFIRDEDNRQRFYALGLKNDDGGYAFSNPMIEGFAGPQAVRFVRNKIATKTDTVNLFSNFRDMLTAFTRFPETYREQDNICLNDHSFLSHAFGYLTGFGYRFLYSWMESSEQGTQADEVIRRYGNRQRGMIHRPMVKLYRTHGSLSDWHINTVHD
jgi:hypothetical protein